MTTYGNWPELLGIAGAVVVAGWLIYWVYRAKLLEREERKLMIERGLTPPAPVPQGWPAVRAREQELRYEERRLRIEKGLDPGVEPVAPRHPEETLRRGLVALAVGLGLLAPYGIVHWSAAPVSDDSAGFLLFLAVIGPIVALYGVANITLYGLTKNRPSAAASPSSPGPRSGS